MSKTDKQQIFKLRFLIPAVLLFIFLFLFYGPIENFRRLFINTAIHTTRFQIFAKMLYTENYINKVIGRIEPEDNPRSDNSLLSHEWDDTITFAEIKGDHFKGYIIKINDPRRLIFPQSDKPEGYLLEQLVVKNEAIGGINASGYADANNRGIVWGTTVIDGEFTTRCYDGEHHVMGGFNKDYKLIIGGFTEEEIIEQQFLWAFEFFPLLVVNGEKPEFQPFSGGLAPRTAIGQTAQGHVLLVVVDGRQVASLGATFEDIQTILYANGAINAINLDGGASSTMVYHGRVINSPSDGEKERLLPNAILFR
ncbi:MAG: phosphodiester glycosidase family protein [Treponema sp.]|nr:phosphodiester glycosidase family protein [Treponema sp.]